jgi:hypothetical protein
LTGTQQFIFLVLKPSNKLKEEKKVSMHNLCPVTDVCAAIIVKFQISKCERTGKRVVMMYFKALTQYSHGVTGENMKSSVRIVYSDVNHACAKYKLQNCQLSQLP